MEPLRIVLGLGNPGARYARTRHNLGFRVVDRLARCWGIRYAVPGELGGKAETAAASTGRRRIVLAKPTTFMNRSGRAAAALCRHYSAGPDDFVVVCDDADLELGRLRVRGAGRAGGHNGLRSLIDVFGTDEFTRVKLGVRGTGRDDGELADYVLAEFEPQEEEIAERLTELAARAVEHMLRSDLTAAMNRFNGARVDAGEGPGSTAD